MIDTASDNQDSSQLFFTNGFKVLFGNSLYNNIITCFNNWNIINNINDISIDKKEFRNINIHSLDNSDETLMQSITINEVMEKAEFGTQKNRFRVNSDSGDIEMQSLYKLINKIGAQLIFNTHNPIYLNGTLLKNDNGYG